MAVKFDWKLGLIALGFMAAAAFVAGYSGEPEPVRAAAAALLLGISAAVPSWLFHRGDS